MPYKSIFIRSFIKGFDKLLKGVKARILEALEKVVEAPSAGSKLRRKPKGL